MSASRIIIRIVIILFCALFGASIGVSLQALRLTSRPQEFRSLAKLVAGPAMGEKNTVTWREQQQDFYGTIIETIEAAEMSSRALERVKALNPDLKVSDVAIRATQIKGSAIFTILATGTDPKYTRLFLDALLDEFIGFRQNIREQAQGKVLQQFLQEVVTHQKAMEDSMAALEKVRARVDNVSARSNQTRLVTRLNSLRNQRDDLRLKFKPMGEADAARPALQTQIGAVESEIQGIEAELQRLEPDLSELRTLTEKFAIRKASFDKLFEQVEKIQATFDTAADYVAIQERATPAFENVEDWRQPISVGAGAGGLLGGLVGLLLSLLIVRTPKPPQIPAVV